jgi:hypothetical protein
MTARRSRRAPRAITTALATTAVALVAAAPGLARPAGWGAAHSSAAAAHAQPAAGDLRVQAQTGSLAGTTEDNLRALHATARPVDTTVSGDDGGATTLAVVLIAAGALAAGAGAGAAGGRGLHRRALT